MTAIKPNNVISVSSPMLYWTLNDGELDSSATTVASHPASTYAINLPLLQAVGTQWGVTNYWTGSGTEVIQALWSAHPTEFDAVFKIANGCGLMWCQINGVQASGGGYILQLGLRGTFVSGITLRIDAGNWKAECQFAGTGDAAVTGVTSSAACLLDPAAPVVIAVLIDHRLDGDNCAMMFNNGIGGVRTNSVTLGDVGSLDMGGTASGKVVNIGSLVTAGGGEFSFYNRSIRNFGFINFGDNMPSNIDKVVTDLLSNNGRLVQSMEGI